MALLEKNEEVTVMTKDVTREKEEKYSSSYFISPP